MSERGVFAVDRGVFDHPVFAPEPFSEREAWLWMLGAAAWRATKIRIGRQVVTVERGQFAHSERFLAVKFRWSKSRVHRFLNRLKIEAMVTLLADHETNLITICNYERYAFDGTSRKSKIGPATEPAADQPRTKEEEPKNLRTEEINKTDSELPLGDVPRETISDWPADYRERFWQQYPKHIGKKAAFKALELIRKRGEVTFEHLMLGVSKIQIPHDPRFIPNPATWLNQGRWDDEPPAQLPLNGAKHAKPDITDTCRELADQARELERNAGIAR